MRKYMRAWRAKNAEHLREYERTRAQRPEIAARRRVAQQTWYQSKGRASRYGLTPDRIEELLDAGCGICGGEVEHIDHDHACCPGKRSCGECVRDGLCAPCNKGLGHFNDSVERLQAAASYLARFQK